MTPEWIGAVVAIATMLGGLVLFAIRGMVAPLRGVIENNTAAMKRLMDITDAHGTRLGEHDVRLACIDERHNMEDRK
jgi:hypothetical protein